MTGLEKILERIEKDGTAAADEVKMRAEAEAAQILCDGEEKAKKAADEIVKAAENRGRVILERAESSAEVEHKRRALSEKQKVIAEIIAEAKNRLCALSGDEYFSVLGKLISRFNEDKNGEIVLSKEDKANLKEGFLPKNLKVAEDEINDRGAILRFGSVEVNCTFTALFEAAESELSDTVNKIVFR